jgi:hypothetical protein
MSRYARQAKSSWAECGICGFDFPQVDMTKHYKFGFLVDRECADELAHLDYMEHLRLPENERPNPTIQRVPDQGQVTPQPAQWNTAQFNVDGLALTPGPIPPQRTK